MSLKVECLDSKFIKPKLDEYKIPKNLIDDSFGLYHHHLKTNDVNLLYKTLWELPVEMICSEKSEQIYSYSYRNV